MAFAQVKYLLQWLKGGVPTDVTTTDRLPVATDGLTDDQLRATPVTVDTGLIQPTTPSDTQPVVDADGARELTQQRRLGGGKTAVVATVVASGDTVVHTPAAGKRIVLYWVSAIGDPTSPSAPVIKIMIGSTEYYRAYAVAHWEPFIGEVDQDLIVNLSSSGNVQFTAHITEID